MTTAATLWAWWQGLWPAAAPRPGARWVVLDVETTGLDPQRCELLAVAALALDTRGARPRLCLHDSFEAVLQRDSGAAPDKANILLHGIGVGAQRGGMAPAQALAAWLQWLDGAPLVAYHAGFDRVVLQRAVRAHLGQALPHRWLDLADLAPVLHPQAAGALPGQALDHWLQHFAIPCTARHQAAADTLATAQLLQRLWPALQGQCPQPRFADAVRLAAQRRWLALEA